MSSHAAGAASVQRPVLLRRCAAAAAVIGGAAWVVKAGVIFATGDEPSATFAIGLVLFPFALLGLRSTLADVSGRAARAGGLLAALAAVCAVSTLVVRAVGGEAVEPTEDEVTALTPFITLTALGTLGALIALGIATRRAQALAHGYASLPLAMGVATIPLLILGTALEGVDERLFEVPIALLGLAWIGLGVALRNSAEHHNDAREQRADV